ncbi:MAG: nucleotide exchange factor GrpE [Gammaproteobacteria bacterium]|nr:nucleotide exchange factor GrpE [Gammaproteobacteria bacterium]
MTDTDKKQEPDTVPVEEDTMENSAVNGADSGGEFDGDALLQELEDAKRVAGECQDKVLRMQAEMENLRKRAQRDVANAHKFAIEKFASELLQVKDSLELGLGAGDVEADKLREGTALTLKILVSTLQKFDIEEIDPAGEVFDPNLHQAMTTQESQEHEPNTVLQVMQKGYTLHERLLRPAMVIVARAPETAGD